MASSKKKPTGPQPIQVQIATPAPPPREGVETVPVKVKNTGKGAIFYGGGRVLLPPLATVELNVDERMLKRLQHQYNKGKIDLTFEDGTKPARAKVGDATPPEAKNLGKSLAKIREGSPELDAAFPPTVDPVEDDTDEDGPASSPFE